METVELACEKRETRPKGLARRLRRAGRVPAVIYGNKGTAAAVAVNAVDLNSRVAAAARQRLILVTSTSPAFNGKYVILKQIQRTPVSGEIIHADFYEVDLKRPIRVAIPLRFVGRAKGVVDGGILQPLERQVEVECLPLEIPEAVAVDVTGVGIHDVIHVSSLNFAGNVRPIFDSDYPVVTVLPPTVAEVAAPPAAVAEGAAPEAAPAAEEAAPAAAATAVAPEGAKEAAGARKS